MSRRTFHGSPATMRIVVGWDPPLQTYFAQVWDTEGSGEQKGDHPVLWVGCAWQEVQTVQELDALLAPYGGVPEPIRAELIADFEFRLDAPLMTVPGMGPPAKKGDE